MDLYIDNKLIEDLEQLKDCFRSGDSNIKNELLSYIRNGSLAEWLSEGGFPEETQMADAVSGLDYESDDVMLWRNVYETIVGGECEEKVPSYSDCFELVSVSSKDCIILEEKILPNVTPIVYVPKGIEVEMCFKFKVKEPKYASVYLFLVNQRSIRFPYGTLKLNKKGVVGLSRKLIFNDDGIWHLIQEENNICDFCVKICSKTLIDEYKLANEGDAVAQYNLGYYFNSGQGVDQSYTEAVKWYRKSVNQGYAMAQCNLGVCYENGRGVEQSYTEAVKLYRMSAEQGNACGQFDLGICYKCGRGVEKSHDEAVKWYRKSVEQGYASAQYSLGYCYEYGEGVEQSYTEAVKWYRKSADQGYAMAQCNLGVCYETGRGVEQSYTEAVKLYRMSAEQGNACGQFDLGLCYEYGRGVEKSHDEAVKWWRKSAEQGYASAIEKLKKFGLQ